MPTPPVPALLPTQKNDLPPIVPTFKVVILNKDLRGILHDEDLTSPRFLALPLTTLSTLLFLALSSLKHLLCTTIFNLKQKFYGWMPFLSPTTASQLQKNADLSQNLKSAAKIKPYPRITTLNSTSKGVLNFLNRAAHNIFLCKDIQIPEIFNI